VWLKWVVDSPHGKKMLCIFCLMRPSRVTGPSSFLVTCEKYSTRLVGTASLVMWFKYWSGYNPSLPFLDVEAKSRHTATKKWRPCLDLLTSRTWLGP
jgi:hypothetical protein